MKEQHNQELLAVKNEDGSYTMQGINQDEVLTLQIDRAQLGTYRLGPGSASFATYVDANENVYTTSPNGSGVIELTDRCIFRDSEFGQEFCRINYHMNGFFRVLTRV